MSNMERNVQNLLGIAQPLSARLIAEGLLADVESVRKVLSDLIAAKKVIRHHSPSGVLSYSLAKPKPSQADQDGSTGGKSPGIKLGRKQFALLCHFGRDARSAGEISRRSGMSMKEVSNLTFMLRQKALVERVEGMDGPHWRLCDGIDPADFNVSRRNTRDEFTVGKSQRAAKAVHMLVTDAFVETVAQSLWQQGWATGGDYESEFKQDVRKALESGVQCG